ncbi:MAG: hypothetical protein II937_11370, partial [Bacteroidales bacterium]|nr:hypothetical protein [Bacteroidales bacterium]
MINKEIKTLNEIRRAKNAYAFTSYYEMDNGTLNFIYDFTASNLNKVIGTDKGLSFYVNGKLVKNIPLKLKGVYEKSIKNVTISDGAFYVSYLHATNFGSSSYYSSDSSYSSSSSYSGGSSNNNNNN